MSQMEVELCNLIASDVITITVPRRLGAKIIINPQAIPRYLNKSETERWLYLYYPEIHKAIYG